MFSSTRKILGIVIALFISTSCIAHAASTVCSKEGYTLEFINGINNTEGDTLLSARALYGKLGDVYNKEPLSIKYLYNPTHGFTTDLDDAVKQKLLEARGNVQDDDFVGIFNEAKRSITTQKVLLIAHSQGNFYSNTFYDTVVDHIGGLPSRSVGMYSIATPANRVSGSGEYVTSTNDRVIADIVTKASTGYTLPAKDTLESTSLLDPGHGLVEVYLKQRPDKIISGINRALGRLTVDPKRAANTPCISVELPQTKTVVIGQVVAEGLAVGANQTIDNAIFATNIVVGTTADAFASSFNFYNEMGLAVAYVMIAVGDTTINTTVAVGNGVRNGALAIGGAIGNTVVGIGSFTRDAVTGLFSGNPETSGGNTASVIGALQNPLPPSHVVPPSIPPPPPTPQVVITPSNNLQPPFIPVPPPSVVLLPPQMPQGSQRLPETSSMPKLVFVGGQNQVLSFGGSSPYQAPVVAVETEPAHEEIPVSPIENPVAPEQLPAPTLTVPQCAFSLATDGCLLATTTVHFEWSAVAGADHYEMDKNGTTATTTGTFTDIIVRDFSQYTFIVSAVDASGLASATSTQTVFVATIPIAINEIAWMGTSASANDEWFEIKNNSPYTIDLSQWELNAKDGTPHVKLVGTIAPRAYLLFERSDDTVVSDVGAHQIYTGALGNAGEQLNLSYASTTLDQTPEITDEVWAAGENGTSTKKTMERYSSREDGSDPTNWGTNLGYVKNGTDANGDEIDGTPGEQNSVSTLINRGEDITSDLTLTADEEQYVIQDRVARVAASATLTLEAGVTISFLGPPLFVSGRLEVLGTAEAPVNFVSTPSQLQRGMVLSGGEGTSTFDYAHFENMGEVKVINTNAEIRNSEFIGLKGGLMFSAGSSSLVENTNFSSSTYHSIYLHANNSSVEVASSTIKNQLSGCAIELSSSVLEMSSSVIENVYDSNGICATGRSSVVIASSTIRNTKDDAISLSGGHDSIIMNSIIEGGDLNDEANGISVVGPTMSGLVEIKNSVISGFIDGAGVSTSLLIPADEGLNSEIFVSISNTEISENAVGVEMESDSVNIAPNVSIHDNGAGPEDNVVVR